MPEIRTVPELYIVDMICDKCNSGVMRTLKEYSLVFNDDRSSPPKYRHKCTSCHHEEVYDCKYPYNSYSYILGPNIKVREDDNIESKNNK